MIRPPEGRDLDPEGVEYESQAQVRITPPLEYR